MVLFRREKAEWLKTLLQVQSSRGASAQEIKGLWDEYTEAVFPFVKGSAVQEKVDAERMLRSFTAAGPLRISGGASGR